MSQKKNVYLRPMTITAESLFGSKLEPIWEHKNCAIPPKSRQKIAKGSIRLQSRIPAFRSKCQKPFVFDQQNGRLALLLKQKTTRQRWLRFSQFLGFTKDSKYAINIVRAFIIGLHERRKDYLDLRSRILLRCEVCNVFKMYIVKEIRGGSTKTVNLIKGGRRNGFFYRIGERRFTFLKCVCECWKRKMRMNQMRE
jgi:hypothetical protein